MWRPCGCKGLSNVGYYYLGNTWELSRSFPSVHSKIPSTWDLLLIVYKLAESAPCSWQMLPVLALGLESGTLASCQPLQALGCKPSCRTHTAHLCSFPLSLICSLLRNAMNFPGTGLVLEVTFTGRKIQSSSLTEPAFISCSATYSCFRTERLQGKSSWTSSVTLGECFSISESIFLYNGEKQHICPHSWWFLWNVQG